SQRKNRMRVTVMSSSEKRGDANTNPRRPDAIFARSTGRDGFDLVGDFQYFSYCAAAMAQPNTAISPTRSENYPDWYQAVIAAADLAETSGVRGCMVIKPWGLSVWENIKRELDGRFKATGHKNAYFPLFIPLSYLAKEAEHIE